MSEDGKAHWQFLSMIEPEHGKTRPSKSCAIVRGGDESSKVIQRTVDTQNILHEAVTHILDQELECKSLEIDEMSPVVYPSRQISHKVTLNGL